MDFKIQNDKEREYFKQDFTEMNVLLKRVRECLVSGKAVKTKDLNLNGILDYKPSNTILYISLFQAGEDFIKYGSIRKSLDESLNRNIEMLRANKRFDKFNVADENECRIMIEFSTERIQTTFRRLQTKEFSEDRFEIGINGIE